MNKPWTGPRTSWHELNKQHHCDIWTKMILAFLQSKTFIASQIKLQSTKNLALSLCQAISRWQGSFWQLCNQLKLNLVINFALSEYLSDLQPYPWILKPVFPSLNCDSLTTWALTPSPMSHQLNHVSETGNASFDCFLKAFHLSISFTASTVLCFMSPFAISPCLVL